MIRFGVIGSSFISQKFIETAHSTQKFQLSAVFSRQLERAQEFAAPFQSAQAFADWQEFLAQDLDAIYIASPNALHYEQAKAVLLAGKHAIVEKPMVCHPDQLAELLRIAKENKVFLLEAARNTYEATFESIGSFLRNHTILGAQFSYAKYSSKMPELLAGTEPNIFSEKMAGGALMDLGVYALYASVTLFGPAQKVAYQAQQLPNTVDLNGFGYLDYGHFQVGIFAGKNLTSTLVNEIYTDKGTLVLDSCQHIQKATFYYHDGSHIDLDIHAPSDNMLEECLSFIHIIEKGDQVLADSLTQRAEAVHQALYDMRQVAGIHFSSDPI